MTSSTFLNSFSTFLCDRVDIFLLSRQGYLEHRLVVYIGLVRFFVSRLLLWLLVGNDINKYRQPTGAITIYPANTRLKISENNFLLIRKHVSIRKLNL
jgi:hypothetical protein